MPIGSSAIRLNASSRMDGKAIERSRPPSTSIVREADRLRLAERRDYTDILERSCRTGMFFKSSSFGIRFFTSSFPFSTRLM